MRNAFEILAEFNLKARRRGWTQEKINDVLKDAKSSDYDHLCEVIERAEEELEFPWRFNKNQNEKAI